MQVDCEFPFAGAPKILRRERFETVPYKAALRNNPSSCLAIGRMRVIPRGAGERGVLHLPAKEFTE
jgi:hypothetical protein